MTRRVETATASETTRTGLNEKNANMKSDIASLAGNMIMVRLSRPSAWSGSSGSPSFAA
jgi:hypothetical protein